MIGEHMWRAGKPTRSEIKEAYRRFFTGGPLGRAGECLIIEPKYRPERTGYICGTRVTKSRNQ
jgi:hypothetical protein